MSCEITIPIQEIVDEVIKQANLGQYLPKQDGVASNITLKNGVTLDPDTVADFCEQLKDCFTDSHVSSFVRDKDSLIIRLNDDTEFSVDLSMYALLNDVEDLKNKLEDLVATVQEKLNKDIDFLRQQLINGDAANKDLITETNADLTKKINDNFITLQKDYSDADQAILDLVNALLVRTAVLEEKVKECCECDCDNNSTP